MKRTKFILVASIFLIISSVVFTLSIKDKIPNNIFCFLDIGTYRIPPTSVEVNSSNIPGQSFVSSFDNLFMMSIYIPKQILNENRELYFHLKRDEDDSEDLVVLKWRFNQIHFLENNFYVVPPDRESSGKGFHFHFQFPVIKDSKNKKFYFYFESPDSKPGEGIKLGVWNNIDYYEALTEGVMFINHRPVNGFLAFRTYNTWKGSAKDIFNEIYSRFSDDIPFAIFYGCLIFVIFAGLLTIGAVNKPKR